MGTASSVDKTVAGKSKTFHVIIKDATDSRPKSGPSYFAEVHVRCDDVINVMFICSEWGSSEGGLSTFNREFAVNLAKAASDRIKVHCYVCRSREEDRVDASNQGVNLITAGRLPGCNDPMEWLKMPPPKFPTLDVVVGHGRKFGSAAYFISDRTKCKWIQFVHVFCEDLGKHKSKRCFTPDVIADNEKKHRQELELCKAADRVVAVGSRLQGKYRKSLSHIKVEVITPGIFENFVTQETPLANVTYIHVQPAEAEEFSIFMVGRGRFEDFEVKGYDIVGEAVALLGKKFELTFVGSPPNEQKRIQEWFLQKTTIVKNQLTIRGYCNNETIKEMFHEADLIVMPSRMEGFGLVALEAISAGVPVLVSSESGIAKALEDVKGGMTVVVNSDKPEDWAEKIRQLSEQKPKDRRDSAMRLRDEYREIYTWTNECEKFKQMIHGLFQRPHRDVPLNCVLTGQTGNITVPITLKVEPVTSAQDKGLVQTNRGSNPLSDANGDTASLVTSLESTAAKNDREGDSATGPAASPSSSKSTQAESGREGDSATAPTGNTSVDKLERMLNSLHSAARVGDVAEIKSLLALGFSIDSRDDKGETPLIKATVLGKLQALKYLLENDADPSLQDNNGWNVLHWASIRGNPDAIELLISHVPSIDSITNEGATSLMVAAAACDNLQAVKYLLEKGADPSLQDNVGRNVLHFASMSGNPDVIELMLGHAPSIDSISNQGVTSLMIAAQFGRLQAVKCLLEKGADPRLQDNKGCNALHYASYGGNVPVIEEILSYGVDIESRDKVGETPLMMAQRHGKSKAVTYLLSKGAKFS